METFLNFLCGSRRSFA